MRSFGSFTGSIERVLNIYPTLTSYSFTAHTPVGAKYGLVTGKQFDKPYMDLDFSFRIYTDE